MTGIIVAMTIEAEKLLSVMENIRSHRGMKTAKVPMFVTVINNKERL